MEEGLRREEGNDSWRVLEFYSGIGGMRYSLMKSGVNAEVVEAFDINDVANDVYQHNFHHRPYQGNIQSLSAAELDRYAAHAWLLSPPCQPYTRQGLQKGSEDARASSFLTILELIPFASNPPRLLFVENVVGFETSDTHQKMTEILAKADFVLQEFILSPLQCGVPYSRPRYFCLAKRKPSSFKYPSYNNQLLLTPVLLFGDNGTSINGKNQCDEGLHDLEQSCEPIRSFLEFKDSRIQVKAESSPLYTSHILAGTSETDVSKDNEIGCDGVPLGSYDVPLSLIERWGSAMDIVYPDSKRCCCFTKSYYRYVKGTGSLLASVQGQNEDKASVLKEQQLRYFTPREVANLHSFPSEFEFPKCISLRQRYALLGNSLSVAVVGPLLRYLFSEPAR